MIDKLESTKDAKMAKGVLKFADRKHFLAKSMHKNLTSALYNFGASELQKGKNGRKIKVQPNRKRKSGCESIQVATKGRSANLTALRISDEKPKRSYNLALAIRGNTYVSKKSDAHVMHSRTRYILTTSETATLPSTMHKLLKIDMWAKTLIFPDFFQTWIDIIKNSLSITGIP